MMAFLYVLRIIGRGTAQSGIHCVLRTGGAGAYGALCKGITMLSTQDYTEFVISTRKAAGSPHRL